MSKFFKMNPGSLLRLAVSFIFSVGFILLILWVSRQYGLSLARLASQEKSTSALTVVGLGILGFATVLVLYIGYALAFYKPDSLEDIVGPQEWSDPID